MVDDNKSEVKTSLLEYEVSLLYAIRRRKDQNPDKKEKDLLFRQIVKDEDVDLKILKERVKKHKGVWRIYKTINKRDTRKAMIDLNLRLTEDRNCDLANRIESIWKTCLMQPKNKTTNYILLDIDTKDNELVTEIINIIESTEIKYLVKETPNGFHIVVYHTKENPFDTRLIRKLNYDNIEIKKDALLFREIINIV